MAGFVCGLWFAHSCFSGTVGASTKIYSHPLKKKRIIQGLIARLRQERPLGTSRDPCTVSPEYLNEGKSVSPNREFHWPNGVMNSPFNGQSRFECTVGRRGDFLHKNRGALTKRGSGCGATRKQYMPLQNSSEHKGTCSFQILASESCTEFLKQG